MEKRTAMAENFADVHADSASAVVGDAGFRMTTAAVSGNTAAAARGVGFGAAAAVVAGGVVLDRQRLVAEARFEEPERACLGCLVDSLDHSCGFTGYPGFATRPRLT